MFLQELQNAIDTNSISIDIAQKYLKLYISDTDWVESISQLWSNSQKKFKNDEMAKAHVKKAIACTVLLPFLEKTNIPTPATHLLFWCPSWKQFDQQDWSAMFLDLLKEDVKIILNRNKIIKLGVIDPIDIPPMTRQAYNWIYEKATESESFDEEQLSDFKEKITNLVRVYGGAVICNLFINHKLNIDKVFNWRTGYFLEKQIYKAYSLDDICTLKKAELVKMNSMYIKNIGNKAGATNE